MQNAIFSAWHSDRAACEMNTLTPKTQQKIVTIVRMHFVADNAQTVWRPQNRKRVCTALANATKKFNINLRQISLVSNTQLLKDSEWIKLFHILSADCVYLVAFYLYGLGSRSGYFLDTNLHEIPGGGKWEKREGKKWEKMTPKWVKRLFLHVYICVCMKKDSINRRGGWLTVGG